ncbi:MAG TPA: DinB family protein [Thermoanaerobaculia bacterium]|nr:DinB family protein [Thermoanaerobaculia bacterium]
MKTAIRAITILLLALCGVATVQAAQHQPPTEALNFWVSNAEREIVPAAEAMPEEKYSFAPAGPGFAGVRTFAEQIKHLAANNYAMCARMAGRKPTPDQESETGPESVRSKAEIVDYLKGSFEALHKSVAALEEKDLTVLTDGKHTPVWLVIDAVSHSYNHYGQIVEYLRANNIIPPASRK